MKRAKLILVWLWVAIPLGWGVLNSVRKAMPLFIVQSTAATPGK
ncbi:MAG TPA: hypothetical protein VGH65_00015 [Verrucomicrobiaceae bacterium]